MALIEKTKQCAGTVACRFRWVLRLAAVGLLVAIVVILFLFAGDTA